MGCDVTNRLSSYHGNIGYAAKIVKDNENGKGNASLKKRFIKADTFYSGIAELNIFKHPWCIMLLFQDYDEQRDKCLARQPKVGKNETAYYNLKGITMDLAMDNADLIKSQKECSSIITLALR